MQALKFKRFSNEFAFALSLAAMVPAYTQEVGGPDGLGFDLVVVTGTSTAIRKMKQSVSVSSLDAEQLEKAGAALSLIHI
jgi:hypothetical protein